MIINFGIAKLIVCVLGAVFGSTIAAAIAYELKISFKKCMLIGALNGSTILACLIIILSIISWV